VLIAADVFPDVIGMHGVAAGVRWALVGAALVAVPSLLLPAVGMRPDPGRGRSGSLIVLGLTNIEMLRTRARQQTEAGADH
jgi:hypothetical protein